MDTRLRSQHVAFGVPASCFGRANCRPRKLLTGWAELGWPSEACLAPAANIRIANSISLSTISITATKWGPRSACTAILGNPSGSVKSPLRCRRLGGHHPGICFPALTLSASDTSGRTTATSAGDSCTTSPTAHSPSAADGNGNGNGNCGAKRGGSMILDTSNDPPGDSLLTAEVTAFASSPCGVMDNSTLASMDWNDWMMSTSSSSSSSDGGEGTLTLPGSGDAGSSAAEKDADGGGSGLAGGASSASATASPPLFSIQGGTTSATIRIAFYAVASSFDRRQLDRRLRESYGNQAVQKYPDVIHCHLSGGRDLLPGSDVFFFDYGVVACWGVSPDTERVLVQDIAVQCAVQPLAERDQERDVFRCTFVTNPDAVTVSTSPADGAAAVRPAEAADGAVIAAAATQAAPVQPFISSDALGSMFDVDYGTSGSLGSTSGTTSSRRYTRRAERSGGAAVAAAVSTVSQPLQPPPVAVGPHSLLSFPPKISDDTVLLHVRHCDDIATLLAVSYALAQSTKLSAFEKAVDIMVRDTQALPEALAEHGEVHLSGKEIGRLIGKVFVLKRSVNLLGSVAETPEFFWYAPDQLQSLYTHITKYVDLSERVEQLNGRFAVLQEMLELLRAQEENRHGNRLELVVIWLIVVEVVLGVFELLELFGVIGPQHGF